MDFFEKLNDVIPLDQLYSQCVVNNDMSGIFPFPDTPYHYLGESSGVGESLECHCRLSPYDFHILSSLF
jgi:hypothetical protein